MAPERREDQQLALDAGKTPVRPKPFSPGPFGYFSTELTSRIVLPCQGVPHYGCINTESNRGDGFNASHISLDVSSRYPQDRSRSATQCVSLARLAQKCLRAPNATGVLDDSPRALGYCRGPFKRKKIRQLCPDTPANIAQGLDHSQNGAVRVDSSQEKPACMRANPVPSCLTPDSTSHVVQRTDLPRIGETAGFGRPTNDMVSVEASACTL